ncbi:MAG: hypothetical protein IID43_06060 [Planctomycetes bacterium]|nr:hypothetical protein [Planctomycetota bacterium]
MNENCQSEVGRLKSVLLKHARDAFVGESAIDEQWRELKYTERPSFGAAVAEYDRFVALLAGFGVETHFLPQDQTVGLDSKYTRDASIVCEKGAILCSMGKEARRNEPAAQESAYRDLGIPICGAITGDGRVEGGDVVWIDERTLAVGRGYRTNDEGIRQLRDLLSDSIDELIVVPLPHHRGPGDVFHLMSIISPIDRDLALVYSPLMPVPFREMLLSRGMKLVEVPESEFDTMGCNVLAVAPRECVMLAGNFETRQRLIAAGATVHEFVGDEICAKGCGGPTCLTRTLERTTAETVPSP